MAASRTVVAQTWSRDLVGPDDEQLVAVLATSDGGAVAAGTWTQGADTDGLLVRMNADGTLRWSQRLGDTPADQLSKLVPVGGDAFLAIGTRTPDVTRGWVVAFDIDGQVLWERSLATGRGDGWGSASAWGGGGALLAGWSHSFPTIGRAQVVAVDAAGDIAWQWGLDHGIHEPARAIPTRDGGLLMMAHDNRGPRGTSCALAVKVDAPRRVEWQVALGDADVEVIADALELDDGFVLLGESTRFMLAGGWLLRLDARGNVITSIVMTSAPTVVRLLSDPSRGFFTFRYQGGPRNFALVRFDEDGTLDWGRNHAARPRFADDVTRGISGGFFVVGGSSMTTTDGWILKLDSDFLVEAACWSSNLAPNQEDLPVTLDATAYTTFDPGFTSTLLAPSPVTRDVLRASPSCPPGEVTGVRVACASGGAALAWDLLPEADSYDVYRGSIPALGPFSYNHVDVGACAVPLPMWTDVGACDAAGSSYYVVVARSALGRGPYGTNSLGTPMPSAPVECP